MVDLYKRGGFDFVRACCKDATYLEEVSGLTAFHAETEALMLSADLEFDDGDDF